MPLGSHASVDNCKRSQIRVSFKISTKWKVCIRILAKADSTGKKTHGIRVRML